MSTTESCEIEVHLHADISDPDQIRDFIEGRCAHASKAYPELAKISISFLREGDGFTAHVHATGRQTNLAVTHDWSRDAGAAVSEVFDRLDAKLRKHHGKRWPANHRRGGSNHHFSDALPDDSQQEDTD